MKIVNNNLNRPFPVDVEQKRFVVDDSHEPRTRDEILAGEPDARFFEDGPLYWRVRDGEEQQQYYRGEPNNGPNGAIFDDDAADVLKDYFGHLYVLTRVMKQEQADGSVLVIKRLYSLAIKWKIRRVDRRIIEEVRHRGNVISRVIGRFIGPKD